jgi:hypothetical protein
MPPELVNDTCCPERVLHPVPHHRLRIVGDLLRRAEMVAVDVDDVAGRRGDADQPDGVGDRVAVG